jgi:GMP synthase (glutamine-hydrolysing)
MNNIAVIDNMQFPIESSARWVGLQRSVDMYRRFTKNDVQLVTVRFDDVKERMKDGTIDNCKGIILSGSPCRIDDFWRNLDRRKMFLDEVELIEDTKRPLLGICFGMQIIGVTFGCTIKDCEKGEQGLAMLDIDPGFPLFNFGDRMVVEMHHSRMIVVDDVFSENFNLYASSDVCDAQVIDHKKRDIFGVQFHPETNEPYAVMDGCAILCNFYNLSIHGKPIFECKQREYVKLPSDVIEMKVSRVEQEW